MRVAARCLAVLILAVACAAQTRPSSPQQPPVAPQRSLQADQVLNAIPFRLLGPASPAGRVWHITGVPQQPKTFYLCTADGGVWKTTNFGTTVEPLWNDTPAASCGPIAVAP